MPAVEVIKIICLVPGEKLILDTKSWTRFFQFPLCVKASVGAQFCNGTVTMTEVTVKTIIINFFKRVNEIRCRR